MSLPIFQTTSKDISMLQTTWSSKLNPVINNELVNGQLLKAIVLINGATVINHLLSRQMQGWVVTDVNGAATIYRSAAFNDKTLTLTSNAVVTVNLWVF